MCLKYSNLKQHTENVGLGGDLKRVEKHGTLHAGGKSGSKGPDAVVCLMYPRNIVEAREQGQRADGPDHVRHSWPFEGLGF